MNPASTRVAPGPNWLSVIASLFQKMLLNSAVGLEKWGAPAGKVAWNTGSFASAARPAACGTPMAEFSDDAVVTLLATVLLRILIGSVNELATKMPPPSSPEKLPWIRLRSIFTAPEPSPAQVAKVAPGLQSA